MSNGKFLEIINRYKSIFCKHFYWFITGGVQLAARDVKFFGPRKDLKALGKYRCCKFLLCHSGKDCTCKLNGKHVKSSLGNIGFQKKVHF